MKRQTGILLAISSLPGNQGIGDFGKQAYRFIDLLAKEHVHVWQILPIHPLGYGNSPYQPLSTFAQDPIYINIDELADLGLLKQSSIRNFNKFSEQVDYDGVREFKEPYLRKAFRNFKKQFKAYKALYEEFCEENVWLETYAIYATLKKKNENACWINWPMEEKEWIKQRNQNEIIAYEDDIYYEKFLQFACYMQWSAIKEYAEYMKVAIMGDMPVYVGIDSADVWDNQHEFLLDKQGNPTVIAGVPPDYFSEVGQRWGNPLYHWKRMKKDRYRFWVKRLAWAKKQFDYIRIDHFRAFDSYWQIPANSDNAVEGEWKEGPSYDFFDVMYRRMPDISIVAEDLGDLRPEVHEMRKHYSMLGMHVLQFDMEPKILKKAIAKDVIVYPGTHDNMTIEEWYEHQHTNKKIALRRFFHNRKYKERSFHELVIRYILHSDAALCILPVQDILGLKKEGRMNTPSTVGSPNWEWKLKNLKELTVKMKLLGEWIVASERNRR